MTLLERIGVELPVVQAGMGGGVAGRDLAGAVSAAGGLGTLGHLAPAALRREIAATRALTDRPIAANLLLPFAREAHFHAASDADVVVTFWGEPRRRTGRIWVHQCGSVGEARAAHVAGADAVIAQGVEAGGHVRGTEPALELLARVRAALPAGYPVWSAGGVADGARAAERLAAGAEAVVSGTRFLLCHESGAHPAYKQRALAAHETVLTELFGAGWPAAHRVVPNAATERPSRAALAARRQPPHRAAAGPHARVGAGPARIALAPRRSPAQPDSSGRRRAGAAARRGPALRGRVRP